MSLSDLNTAAAVRLELLKICHRPDRSAEEITAHACKLENYVLLSEPSVDSTATQKPEKKPRADKAKAPA